MDAKIKLLLGLAAAAGIVWYGWAMAHVFFNTGINVREDLDLNHQIGMVIGVSIIGSLVMAVGFIVLSYSWLNIWYKAIIGIFFTFVALSLSAVAMSLAAITR